MCVSGAENAVTNRYGSLQVLRGVGAMLVVIQHLAMVESRYLAGPAVMPAAAGFAGCGVDLFFVISGFVIVTSVRRDFDHPRAVVPFVVRRFVRIYPIYWFYTTIALIVANLFPRWIHDAYQWPDILASYALWPSDKVPLLSVGWTLIYEVWFYGVIALAILLVPLAGLARFLLLWAVLIVLGATVFARDAIPPFVTVATHPLGLEFIAGALVALAWRQVPGWLGLPLLWLWRRSRFGEHVRGDRIFLGIPYRVGTGSGIRYPKRHSGSWMCRLGRSEKSQVQGLASGRWRCLLFALSLPLLRGAGGGKGGAGLPAADLRRSACSHSRRSLHGQPCRRTAQLPVYRATSAESRPRTSSPSGRRNSRCAS